MLGEDIGPNCSSWSRSRYSMQYVVTVQYADISRFFPVDNSPCRDERDDLKG